MSAISGIGGLLPTYRMINRTKLIAIANKRQLYVDIHLLKNS